MAAPCVAGFAALLSEKTRLANKGRVSGETMFELLRTFTVDVLTGTTADGAGFVTAYPSLPTVENAAWILPQMEFGKSMLRAA